MTTFAEVIRAAIPDADEGDIEHVLWARTPFPMGRVTARSLFKAASGWRRAGAHGIALCDHCHWPAIPGSTTCPACTEILSEARQPHPEIGRHNPVRM